MQHDIIYAVHISYTSIFVSSQKIRFYEQVITHKTHDKRTRVFYEQKIIANMNDIFYVHAENERKTEK